MFSGNPKVLDCQTLTYFGATNSQPRGIGSCSLMLSRIVKISFVDIQERIAHPLKEIQNNGPIKPDMSGTGVDPQ